MIKNKEDYMRYLEQDRIALGINKKRPSLYKFGKNGIWKFQILYRKYEYYKNTKSGILWILYTAFLKYQFDKMSCKFGFSIPINVFGPGLSIAHYGTIVVNGNAKIGSNCRIQENVTIGATNGEKGAPQLGDNIFIGSGAKIIGDINIANDIAIGAGSVVVKSFTEPGITIAGIPAKKISEKNSHSNLNTELFKIREESC